MPRKTTAATQNSPIEVHTTVTTPQAAAAEQKPDDRPDFWSYMQSLTPEQWKDHIVYLTRDNPRTSINGMGGYLTKLSQAFDIEDIKTAFGGYEFSYIMKKGNNMIYKGTFRVEAPPKYDLTRENPGTVPAPAAGGTMGGDVLKVLEQQNERLYQVLTTLQGKESDPAVSGAIDILTSAYTKGLDAVATQRPETGAGGLKQLDDVLAIAERIVSVRGGGNGNSLTEAIKTLSELGVLNKPKSLAEQLTEAKALVDLLGGGGEGNPKDWKAQLAKAAVDHLPEILETLRTSSTNTIAAAQARRALPPPAPGPQPAPAGQRVPPAAARPAAAPPAPAIHVTGGLELVPRDSSMETTAGAAREAVSVESAAPAPETQEQYDAAMKIQMVNMMRMGASGGAIASFLEDVKPEMAKDLTKYDSTTITKFFLEDPVLKLMVEDPRWQEVLADAKEYLSEEVPVN